MLTANPFIEKSSYGIHFSGNRYTYVLNNPLKYTDPSGYKVVNRDYKEEAMYYQMQSVIDDWNYRSYAPGGGGAGGSRYSNYINSVHQNPDEWQYDHSTGKYRNKRSGERIDPNSEAGHHILNSIGLDRYLEKVDVEYLANLIVLNQGEASNRVNSEGGGIFNYVLGILSTPNRINKSDGSIVDQILIWMEYIDQNSDLDIYLSDIVNSSLFVRAFNIQARGHGGKEGKVEFWIQNPNSSPVLYKNYPIEYIKYNKEDKSISIMIMRSDYNSWEGPRGAYIQSNDSDLIWRYYSTIKHYKFQ